MSVGGVPVGAGREGGVPLRTVLVVDVGGQCELRAGPEGLEREADHVGGLDGVVAPVGHHEGVHELVQGGEDLLHDGLQRRSLLLRLQHDDTSSPIHRHHVRVRERPWPACLPACSEGGREGWGGGTLYSYFLTSFRRASSPFCMSSTSFDTTAPMIASAPTNTHTTHDSETGRRTQWLSVCLSGCV